MAQVADPDYGGLIEEAELAARYAARTGGGAGPAPADPLRSSIEQMRKDLQATTNRTIGVIVNSGKETKDGLRAIVDGIAALPAAIVVAMPKPDSKAEIPKVDPLLHEKLDDLNRRFAGIEKKSTGQQNPDPERDSYVARYERERIEKSQSRRGLFRLIAGIVAVGLLLWWVMTPYAPGKSLFAGVGGYSPSRASDAAVYKEFADDCAEQRGTIYDSTEWSGLKPGQKHCHRPASWKVDTRD